LETDLYIPKDDQVIGAKYAESFWLFFFLSIYSAVHLYVLETPIQKQKAGSTADPTSYSTQSIITVALSALVLALASGDEVGYGSFLLVYSQFNLKFSESSGQYLTSLYWTFFTIGRLIAIPLATIMSNQSMLVLELCITIVASIFLFVLNQLTWALWIGTAIFGLGISAIFPTVMSLTENYVNLTGRFATAIIVGAAIGEMICPLAFGLFTTQENPIPFVYLVNLIIFLCAGATYFLIKEGAKSILEKRKMESKEDESEMSTIKVYPGH